jgi:phage tail sheath protein FI
MANGFIFTSPGVKFRERDLSFVTRNVGVTTLGVVGETLKGPAFEPVLIQDAAVFRTRFGVQSTETFPNGSLKYQLPYVANAYLEESSQLYVTRVLGLSGYDAGTAWGITASAGIDLSTTGVTNAGTVATFNAIDNSYLGVTLNSVGESGVFFSGFTKTGANTFEGDRVIFSATTINNGNITGDTRTERISGSSLTEYEDMVIAVIRSRATVTDGEDTASQTNFEATSLAITANETNTGTGDLFGVFEITVNQGQSDEEIYSVSLDPNSRNYIGNVLGTKPKGKNNKIWVEAVYPNLIKKADADGLFYGINTSVINADSNAYTDYREQFQNPETPWIVSELKGNEIERLFKFISISDGDSANQEIKISITNIDPVNKEFNIVVRDFNDTDQNQIVLESFTRCTMREGETNYIGNRIGTSNGDYPLRSEFIMLELNEEVNQDSFPAGFEGYVQRNWASSATTSGTEGVAPKIFYKTAYQTDERLTQTYLGVSENGYDGQSLQGTRYDQDHFDYKGMIALSNESGVKSKGFHLDSGATGVYSDGETFIGEFEVGAGQLRTVSDVLNGDVYEELFSRKFTVVPAGGFDGWDVHRNERSHGDLYRKGGIFDGVADGLTPNTDFVAWETAIDTFANPEDVTINLFATPAINWSDNNILVKNTLDMIESERTDSLYVMDAPDIVVPQTVGSRTDVVFSNDITNLLEAADIDSSYAATYAPWIQINDAQNNKRVYLPPTGEVVKAFAFTDNVKFPWFATAGFNRGVTSAARSRYKLSQGARDVLYEGRINPLVDFVDVGNVIFGQKTLQVRESSLDRINVRRLLLQTKVLISNVATRLLFEQNDQTTVDQFLSRTNPILDTIRRERGLDDFRVKMDDSINSPESRARNELYGEILLRPTAAVEFIGITFTITPAGASFDDV